MSSPSNNVVIIGGGPAGLTAAYQLCKASVPSVVLEKDPVCGGLARTVNYKGYCFDIGGHRFFTKVRAVEDIWREVLSDGDFLRCKRLSRIYYKKKFYHYPLRSLEALFNLGLFNSSLIMLSFVKARLTPEKEETFEQWVSNRFGKRFFQIFFRSYTEKVWGIPCNEISAEWAAQRIRNLSLLTVVKNVFLRTNAEGKARLIRTLVDEFNYPKRGPGMMWNRMAELVEENGGAVRLDAEVQKICWANNRVEGVEIQINQQRDVVRGSHFISSMPIRDLMQRLDPAVPANVLKAATSLNYRDFITVALVINRREVFPDNWIYINDPNVRLGRIQNFKNWSPFMVCDSNKTFLGLEYFCFEGDGLWTMSDHEIVEYGKNELVALGLVNAFEIEEGTVVRMPKAYPVYDIGYRESLNVIRQFLSRLTNLQLVGRNGMHKYNNQDHSMLTAMLAVKNILGAKYDLWSVNSDPEYHEETEVGASDAFEFARLNSTQPKVPERVMSSKKV